MQDTKIACKETSIRANIAYLKDNIKRKNREKPYYAFCRRQKNNEFEGGLIELKNVEKTHSLRACLIHSKYAIISAKKTAKNKDKIVVKTKPKWLTTLMRMEKIEGVFLPTQILETNDFKASNYKKILALDRFCAKYQPLYQAKQVSLLFVTLTRANFARLTISELLYDAQKKYARNGVKILDYVWTFEISEALHLHYHICFGIGRINIKGKKLPEWLKLDELWGQSTQVEFIKRNVRHYMAKYFAKNQFRAIGYKSFGISKIK
jgi:hypothetical protein